LEANWFAIHVSRHTMGLVSRDEVLISITKEGVGMATQTIINQQTISTKLVLTLFAAMIMAFAFVAFLTNMIVNSKVSAAYQNNPVTVAAPTQTNAVPAPVVAGGACVVPASAASGEVVSTVSGSGGTLYLPWSGGYALAGTYSPSNSSTINTTSTNTYINDSYNTANMTATDNRWSGNTLIANNGNTDNRNSGNTYTDNRNSGNTTNTTTTINTDNSNNSTNTNIQNSGNTTNTTLNTLIDNSQQNNTAVAVGGLGVAVITD
jgi:hypothetical protein